MSQKTDGQADEAKGTCWVQSRRTFPDLVTVRESFGSGQTSQGVMHDLEPLGVTLRLIALAVHEGWCR